MDDVARQVQYLIGLVQNTRSLTLRLSAAIAAGTAPEIVYAAKALHENRMTLAKTEVDIETLAAAHRAGRKARVTADLNQAWRDGVAEGMRRAHAREHARSKPFQVLRLVRTMPLPLRLDRDQP